jgi:hypothetical protein
VVQGYVGEEAREASSMIPRPFACNVKGKDWETVIYAATRSKARYQFWRGILESWPDIPIMAVTVQACGAFESLKFRQVAKYRGLDFVRQGSQVELSDGRRGYIVDSNDSCNFVIDFNGQRLHCQSPM